MPIGLTNRPELASQQALIQAALVRIRQEKMRPLLPVVMMVAARPHRRRGSSAKLGYLRQLKEVWK